MTAAAQRDFMATETLIQERINFYHETMNERLALKDRWITDRFTEIDKRIDGMIHALEESIDGLKELLQHDLAGHREWAESQHTLRQKRFEDYVENAKKSGEQIIASHMQMHMTTDKNYEEFKGNIQSQLVAMVKVLETLREERAQFVLRDAYDSKTDALEKLALSQEKALTEKLELYINQVKDALDAKTQINTDRIAKLEQNLQIMNAKNQQSVIALGVLLMLVEVIIRFTISNVERLKRNVTCLSVSRCPTLFTVGIPTF